MSFYITLHYSHQTQSMWVNHPHQYSSFDEWKNSFADSLMLSFVENTTQEWFYKDLNDSVCDLDEFLFSSFKNYISNSGKEECEIIVSDSAKGNKNGSSSRLQNSRGNGFEQALNGAIGNNLEIVVEFKSQFTWDFYNRQKKEVKIEAAFRNYFLEKLGYEEILELESICLVPEIYYERNEQNMFEKDLKKVMKSNKRKIDEYFSIHLNERLAGFKRTSQISVKVIPPYSSSSPDTLPAPALLKDILSSVFVFTNFLYYYSTDSDILSDKLPSLVCQDSLISKIEQPNEWSPYFTELSKMEKEFKNEILECFKYPPYYSANSLVFGQSGSGKTYLVINCFKNIIGAQPIFSSIEAKLRTKYVSESSQMISNWLYEARQAPYILRYFFIDEAHLLFESGDKSGSSSNSSEKEITSTLLDALADTHNMYKNVVFILATNYPEKIPNEVKRDGRIALTKLVSTLPYSNIVDILKHKFNLTRGRNFDILAHSLVNCTVSQVTSLFSYYQKHPYFLTSDFNETLKQVHQFFMRNNNERYSMFITETFYDKKDLNFLSTCMNYVDKFGYEIKKIFDGKSILKVCLKGETGYDLFKFVACIHLSIGNCRMVKWYGSKIMEENRNNIQRYFDEQLQFLEQIAKIDTSEKIIVVFDVSEIYGFEIGNISINKSETFGNSSTVGTTQNVSKTSGYSQNWSRNDSYGNSSTQGRNTSNNYSYGVSSGQNVGYGYAKGIGTASTTGNSSSTSVSASVGFPWFASVSASYSSGSFSSKTVSENETRSQNYGYSHNQSHNAGSSSGNSYSDTNSRTNSTGYTYGRNNSSTESFGTNQSNTNQYSGTYSVATSFKKRNEENYREIEPIISRFYERALMIPNIFIVKLVLLPTNISLEEEFTIKNLLGL